MTTTPSIMERRQAILAQIDSIPVIVPGKLGARRGPDGKVTGHKLQHWSGGRNRTRHIPADQVAAVAEGAEGYRRMRELAAEYAEVRAEEVLAPEPGEAQASKKKPLKR